jgi:HlyD family secretion protein
MNRIIPPAIVVLGFAAYWSLASVSAGEQPHAAAAAEQESGAKPVAEATEEPQQAESKKKSERRTYAVVPKSLKIDESVDGTFVARKASEVILRPKEWSEFKIKEVVAHGAKVREGQPLIKFDGEKLQQAIADLEIDLHLNEVSLNRAEQELPQKEQSLERQLDNAEETMRRVEEDSHRYQETERQQSLDQAEMQLKSAKFYLDYETDELEQLEKMYEADDLTEETEEIILRRQRFYVEYAQFSYDLAKYYHKRTRDVTIPRRDRDIEDLLKAAKQNLDLARTAEEVDPNAARYKLEKLKADRKKLLQKHVKLLADKSLMTVKSPASGIVYYGSCDDGKWSQLEDMRAKLLPGNDVKKDSVLMTVVDASSPDFLMNLDVKYLISLEKGDDIEVEPAVEGAEKIKGTMASISAVPVSEGKFAAKVEFYNDLPAWLVPGIAGKTKIAVYQKKDALLVPTEAVHKDDGTDNEYVWLIENGDVTKTPVKTGKTKGKVSEVTSGLSAGDVVSLEDEEKTKTEGDKPKQHCPARDRNSPDLPP